MHRHASANRAFRLVWSAVAGTWVAVAESARGQGKRSVRARGLLLLVLSGTLCSAALAQALPAVPNPALIGIQSPALPALAPTALPTGAQVVQGQGSLSQTGSTLTVQQASARLVTNWDTFDIGESALVRFVQPSSSSVALNRVLSGDATQIMGGLEANGQVFIVNTAGVLFGRSARVDVGGLVASSLPVADADFMAGRTVFAGVGGASSGGAVENQGQIQAGAYVAFMAPRVRNSGVVLVPQGDVVMAAGEQVSLDFAGDRLLRFSVDKGTVDALVANQGLVQAAGGRVVLSARAADAVARAVVHQGGVVDASSLSERGGRVVLEGDAVELAAGSLTRADGATGGGLVQVGGAWQGGAGVREARSVSMDAGAEVSADATRSGAGGEVVLWSDVHAPDGLTVAAGRLSARGISQGGRIETSGHAVQTAGARVDAGASQGPGGLWLIDPYDYFIDVPQAATIVGALNTGTSVTVDTTLNDASQGSMGAGAGSITVAAPIAKSAGGDATLTLKAHQNITENASITSSAGKLGVVLWADQDASGGGVITVRNNAAITTNGGDIVMGGGLDTNADGRPDGAATGGPHGVNLNQASVNAGSGNISVRGASNQIGSGAGNGVTLTQSSSLIGQDIVITGTGAANAATYGNNIGVQVINAASITASGSLSITGTGGGSGSTAGGNHGVLIQGSVTGTGSGAVTLTGTGGGKSGGGANNDGVALSGGASIRSGSGALTINGSQGLNANSEGIEMNNAALGAASGQSGAITLAADTMLYLTTNTLQTTGAAVIEPMGASFTSPVAVGLAVTNASSLRIGKVGNTGNVTLSSAASVAGPVSIYGGTVTLNASLTSTDTGDIFIKALATGGNSLLIAGDILKTGGARSTLTLQAGGQMRLGGSNKIQATGTALDVVAWSDYGQTNTGGVSLNGNVTTNGGHLWAGGSNSSGGSLLWNGLTVGDGPSVSYSGANWNALEANGQINTAGGDVLLWGGLGYNGGVGIAGNSAKPLTAGSGKVTLLANSLATLPVSTTGMLTLAPYGGGYGAAMTWSGAMSGADMTITGTYAGLTIKNSATLSGLTLGQYSGMLQAGSPLIKDNDSDVTLASATSVAGAIAVYGNHITLNANLTSTAAGDIFIKSQAADNNSIVLNADILKTGGARSTLTLQAGGRLWLNSGTKIQATGTALDVVAWSDFGNDNGGGITLLGNVTTNGGHLWAGGSNSTGGSLVWNGLTVGDGPSVSNGSANYNAIDVTGQVNTGGGDVLLWAGLGYATGSVGIAGNSARPLTAGNGKVTLLTNSVATLPVSTTGMLTLAPYEDSYTGALAWNGTTATDMTVTGTYAGLTIKNMASLGGLTLGQYSGMLQTGTLTPKVMDNSSNVTLAAATSLAGPIAVYGYHVALNANLSSTGAGAVLLNAAGNVTQATGVTASSQGGAITYEADSDGNGSGSIVMASGSTIASNGGAVTLDAATSQDVIGIDLNGASISTGLGALTLDGSGTASAVRVRTGSTVTAASMHITGEGVVRLESALTATNGNIRIEADRFVNNAGASALNVQNAAYDWQVWSRNADPFNPTTGDVRGGLVYDFKQYDYASGDAVLGSGDGLLYSYAPVLNVDVTGSVTRVYDGSVAALLGTGNYSYSGTVDGDGNVTFSSTATYTTAGTGVGIKDVGSGKTVSVTDMAFASASNGSAQVYGYQVNPGVSTLSGAITPRAITAITGITAASKIYDGGIGAVLTTSGAGFTGIVSGETLSVASATGAFADKNVGNGKTVAITGLALGGADAGNYTLTTTTASTTANITPKAISVITGLTAANRIYDGGTGATLVTSGAGFTGMVGGDALNVASATGAFADKNVGNGKTVAITGLSLGGADAGNYTLSTTTASTTANITPKAISAITGITAASKVYDGNAAAALTTTGAGFTGMVGGDALNVASSTGAFADKNAATGKTVAITGLSLGGLDAGNYTLTDTTASTTADITPKLLTLAGFAAASKVYDGSMAATITNAGSLTGVVGSDAVTASNTGAAFGDKNVGTGKTVTLGGVALSGGDAGNYTVAATATTTANITPKAIAAITGITAASKVYDGNASAALTTSGAGFTGMVSGDALSVASSSGAFANKNAGLGKTVAITGLTLGGADAGNYTLTATTASTTANITPKAIAAITGITAANKVYDGAAGATLVTSGVGFTGMVGGDALNVASSTGTFADKNVGNGKAVAITGLTLGGTDAGNYTLTTTTASATADITPKAITAITGITAANKVYDGATATSLGTANAGFTGMVDGDGLMVTSGSGAFADKNVGTGKTVAITGLTLGGADAGNYTLTTTTASTTADITPKLLTLAGFAAANKIYDGGLGAVITNAGSLTGVVGSDAVTASNTGAAFGDKNVGAGKTVTLSGVALAGGDAGNYTVATTATSTADITPKAIAAITGITAANKVYDGSAAAALTTTSAGFTGMVGGDALSVASSTGAFADKHAATGKTVAITGLSLGGADAGNYTLTTTTASTTADITPKLLTLAGFAAASKVYDGSMAATITNAGSLTGVVGSDAVTASNTGAAFGDKNVGSAKTVTLDGVALSGGDAGNYTVAATASTTADITPKAIAAITGITAASKVYDGGTAASLTTSGAGFTGMVGGDALSVASSSGAFSDKNVATGKTVAITGLSLGGTDASNYTLTDTTASTTADITPKAIAAITGIAAASKVYDGNAAATLTTSGASFTGMVGGDTLTVASSAGSFADKNAATGKTVAITGLTLGGLDAGNYTLTSTTASTTADITPKAITAITGITAASKIYDGNTAAALTTTGAGFTGMVGGDVLSVASSTGAFADKNAATGKTVAITGLSLGGLDAGNYTLTATTASTSADITPKWLTATVSAPDKVYDGTQAAAPILTLNGLVAGETLGHQTTGSFNSKDVWAAHTVTVTGIALQDGSGLAGNYRIASGQTASARITPRELMLSVPGANKVYDGSTAIQISGAAALLGLIGSDQVQLGLGQVTGFVDKHAGLNKTVQYTGFALTGADAANYLLPQQATSDAHITPRPLTLTFTAQDKTYDGQTLASALTQDNRLTGDAFTVGFQAGFADKNVGSGKAVSITGIVLTGPDAGNYTTAAGAQSQASILRLGAVQWTGGATGDWFDPANWAGGAVPDLGNVATVHLPAGVNVTFDGAAQGPVQLDALQGAQGQMTLGSGALHVAGDVQLHQLTQTGGALAVGGDLSLHTGLASGGTLQVDGSASADALTLSGTAQVAIEGALTAQQLTQLGGSLNVGGDTHIDTLSQSGGTLTLDGDLTLATGSASGGELHVGGSANADALTLNGTAQVDIDGDLTVRQLTQHGGNLNVGGDADIDILSQSGGALTLDGDLTLVTGSVTGGTLQVGGDALADALTLDGAAQVGITGDLTVRQLTQLGGNLSAGGDTHIEALSQSGGTLSLGGSLTVTQAFAQPGSGQIEVAGATQITATQGALTLGNLHSGGPLTAVSHSGAITQTPGTQLWVQGPAQFVARTTAGADADIVLDQSGNRFQAPVSLDGHSATVHGLGGLTLGELALSGNLVARTDGALNLGQGRVGGSVQGAAQLGITQTGGLAVQGNIVLNGGRGDIVLDHPDNDWRGLVQLTTTGQVAASGGQIAAAVTQQAPVAPQRLPAQAWAPAAVGQGAEMQPIVVIRHEPDALPAGTPMRFTVELGSQPQTYEAVVTDGVLTVHLPPGTRLTATERQQVVDAALEAVRQEGAAPPSRVELVATPGASSGPAA